MPIRSISADEAIAGLDRFDSVIDARSPSEYAEDRLPGALNWPSLNDEERHIVGTEYAQVSPFEARKRGAALAARNIAAHIEREVMDKPRDWRPLVYCWRGGQRSGALATVLGAIGFEVHLLDGGYRAFRRAVRQALETLPLAFSYRVVCGTTGSAKSRLLQALAARGAQVLDLEQLANHRGSVLGLVPGSPQPGQKQFETRIWQTLHGFNPQRVVWIESESRKVGELRVPEALVARMRASPCLQLELPIEARVALLVEDYDFFVRDIDTFCRRLDALRTLRGHEVVNGWQAAARAGRIEAVVRELLEQHYDPVYLQSMRRNFEGFDAAEVIRLPNGSRDALDELARKLSAPLVHVQTAVEGEVGAGREG